MEEKRLGRKAILFVFGMNREVLKILFFIKLVYIEFLSEFHRVLNNHIVAQVKNPSVAISTTKPSLKNRIIAVNILLLIINFSRLKCFISLLIICKSPLKCFISPLMFYKSRLIFCISLLKYFVSLLKYFVSLLKFYKSLLK